MREDAGLMVSATDTQVRTLLTGLVDNWFQVSLIYVEIFDTDSTLDEPTRIAGTLEVQALENLALPVMDSFMDIANNVCTMRHLQVRVEQRVKDGYDEFWLIPTPVS